MKFEGSVIELIKTRVSTRTFDDKDIDQAAVDQLNGFIAEMNAERRFKGRFILVQNKQITDGKKLKLGTYGIISGVQSFIVTVMDKSENDAAAVGFLFEKIVLFATGLGLQTCWLGGTFNKSEFEKSVLLSEQEYIPIVSPVGHARHKPRAFESVMRAAIGANRRKHWGELFFNGKQVPMDKHSAGDYSEPLEMVRLSPSASNKQPWRIICDEKAFHFFLCRTPGYGLPSYDMQMNDMGIAKCHFEMTAFELGLKGSWQVLSEVGSPAKWEYTFSWLSD